MKVQKHLHSPHERVDKSSQRPGSGLRVGNARDDAAGLDIAERMNTRVRSLNAGMRNANDGMCLLKTVESGLEQVNNLLQGMRELAQQSSNGSYSVRDRESLNKEFTTLNRQVARVVSTTEFIGRKVLADGDGSMNFQLGPDTQDDDTLTVGLVHVEPLVANIGTVEDALASVANIDSMTASIASLQSGVGTMQGRFDSAVNKLQHGVENQASASGRIMNADVAVKTATLARDQALQQSNMAMWVQANAAPQSVKQLLG